MTVTTEILDVTPEIARIFLKANVRNRNLRAIDVDRYARDMKAGRWQFTGEAIKFSKTGVLLDGQHRLHAIIKAGVTVKMLVVSGLDDPAQHVMDTGAKRTAGDALSLSGVRNAALCAAGARLAILWESGLLSRDHNRQNVTTSEIEEWLAKRPTFHRSVTRISTAKGRIECPPSVLVAAHWRFSQVDPEAADEFFTSLATLTNLGPGSPILALHHRFNRIRARKRETSQADYVRLIERAWNHWRNGRQVSAIVISKKKGRKRNAEDI